MLLYNLISLRRWAEVELHTGDDILRTLVMYALTRGG